MVIWLLAGLMWPILGINCQNAGYDPESAAIGDEMSPAYYRRKASRMPVIVLGEPIRVRGTEQGEDVLGPGFVFGDELDGKDYEDYEAEDGERDEEGGEDEGEQQSSLPLPPPEVNMRQVFFFWLMYIISTPFTGAPSIVERTSH